VVSGGRTFVPVLTEQDYYRAESEQIEVFAPLVPIDRVWVEGLAEDNGATDRASTALDEPQRRTPVTALAAASVLGRRVVQAVPDGHVRDLRAVTELFASSTGLACLRICGEADWYRWASTGSTPSTAEVDAEAVWVE
jgi:hypothetical protein